MSLSLPLEVAGAKNGVNCNSSVTERPKNIKCGIYLLDKKYLKEHILKKSKFKKCERYEERSKNVLNCASTQSQKVHN